MKPNHDSFVYWRANDYSPPVVLVVGYCVQDAMLHIPHDADVIIITLPYATIIFFFACP